MAPLWGITNPLSYPLGRIVFIGYGYSLLLGLSDVSKGPHPDCNTCIYSVYRLNNKWIENGFCFPVPSFHFQSPVRRRCVFWNGPQSLYLAHVILGSGSFVYILYGFLYKRHCHMHVSLLSILFLYSIPLRGSSQYQTF